MKIVRLSTSLLTLSFLGACATGDNSSYKQGVSGNVLNYREFTGVMHNQQNTLNSCFNAAGVSKEANALAICAVLAAGTNAQQTLASQPEAIRVAKSPEEIQESLLTAGLDATVKIFGLAQVASVMKSGFAAAAKDPVVEVVRPEIVNPVIVESGAVSE